MRSTRHPSKFLSPFCGLLFVSALLLAACGDDDGAGTAGSPTKVTITVSSESLATQLIRLAEDLGYFDKNGVDVTLMTTKGGAQAVTAMLSRNAEFAAAGSPEVITTNAEGQKVKAIARLYAGLSGSIVLSKETAQRLGIDTTTPVAQRLKSPDLPIEERLKALNGLEVSFASSTSSLKEPVMSSAESVGAKVRPVYMDQASMPAALTRGSIDALQASPPVSEQGVKGGGVMWIEGPLNEFPEQFTPSASSTLMTTEAYIKDHGDVVKKVSAAITEAAQLAKDHPDQARDNIKKRFGDVDSDIFDATWEANKAAFTTPHITAEQFVHDLTVLPQASLTDKVTALDPADLVAEDYSPQDAS